VDVSGVSGTGKVADAVRFPDGTTVLKWNRVASSLGVYDSLEDAVLIHGHDGRTKFVPV
jgi:hypothetical protein